MTTDAKLGCTQAADLFPYFQDLSEHSSVTLMSGYAGDGGRLQIMGRRVAGVGGAGDGGGDHLLGQEVSDGYCVRALDLTQRQEDGTLPPGAWGPWRPAPLPWGDGQAVGVPWPVEVANRVYVLQATRGETGTIKVSASSQRFDGTWSDTKQVADTEALGTDAARLASAMAAPLPTSDGILLALAVREDTTPDTPVLALFRKSASGVEQLTTING